jgi:hypothetical protein
MKDPGLVILAVLAFGFFFVVLPVALTAFGEYRRPRGVVCPEAACAATVGVDTRHATWTAVLGRLRLRVASCSLWPGRRGCAETCLKAPTFDT